LQPPSPAAPALTEPEPSYSPSVSEEEIAPEPLPRLRRRNETADVDAVAMLLGLSQADEDGTTSSHPRANTNNAASNRPKRPLSSSNAGTPGPNSKNSTMTKKGATRMGPGDNRVRPPKAATKLLPEAKWRHIRLPDVQSALEAEDIVVLWGHYKFPEALPRNKAESHLNFVWRHYKDSQLKILLEPIQSAFELENFLKDRYGVGTSTKKPKTSAGPSNTTSGNGTLPPLPPPQQQVTAHTAAVSAPALLLAERRKPLSKQAIGYEKQQPQQQQQQQSTPTSPAALNNPNNYNSNFKGNNENGSRQMIRQSSKEMAGLLYIGAGLTDSQEIDDNESPAENGGNDGSVEDNRSSLELEKPSSGGDPEIKKEAEVVEKEEKQVVAAAGAIAPSVAEILAQQQMDISFATALAAAAATGAGAGAAPGANGNNSSDAAAAAAAANAAVAAAQASSLIDPTASFLAAAAAANGMHMPPSLAFPNMLHPAWTNILSNPLAWQLAGGGLPFPSPNISNNNSDNAGGASKDDATNTGIPPPNMAAMFPGLQFPGASVNAFNQLTAQLAGFPNLPSLHPSTAAAAAGVDGVAGNVPLNTNTTQKDANMAMNNNVNSNNEGAGGKYNTGDRPGRPPSYDVMVRWCVNLKRSLWQRHVPLTIEEAVTMVNDPALCARPPALSEKSRVLVASTLRKRVLGIYKITWSQVATDADPGLHEEVTDPSVHAAAGIKLKKHGMEPGRPGGNNTSNSSRPPVAAASPGVVAGGSSAAANCAIPGLMLPPGLLGSNPTAEELSAFANENPALMAAAAAAAAAVAANANGNNPTAAGNRTETRVPIIKKEAEVISHASANRDVSEAATAAREAAIAAAATMTTQLQGNNHLAGSALPPTLPPMNSCLEDMRNAMGLEIEVKELSPGATATTAAPHVVPPPIATLPPSSVKEMLKLMQQEQRQQEEQLRALAAANPVPAAGDALPIAVPITAAAAVNGGGHGVAGRSFVDTDLPSIGSLERAMDSVDGITAPPPAGGAVAAAAAAVAAVEAAVGAANGNAQTTAVIDPSKEAFRIKFAGVDATDSDGMFGAMCDLHNVAGISKQECASICRLWLENVLNDIQKKQLFMYIKANIAEEDLVADWVKSFIRKHSG
jgi:hypothetical protein